MDTDMVTWMIASICILIFGLLAVYFGTRAWHTKAQRQRTLLIKTMRRLNHQTDQLIAKLNDHFRSSAMLTSITYIQPPLEEYFTTLQHIKAEIVNSENFDFVGRLSSVEQINILLKNTAALLALTEKINVELDDYNWIDLNNLN